MKLNNNDYIDTRQFTEKECEKFCELAVSQGFGRGEWVSYYGGKDLPFLAVHCKEMYWGSFHLHYGNNVSEQFKNYLNEQLNASPKSLLKDGMRVMLRGKGVRYFLDGHLIDRSYFFRSNIESYSDNLEFEGLSPLDVMIIVDRDGTIVWEREEQPTPKEMTVAEIEKALGHSIKVVK